MRLLSGFVDHEPFKAIIMVIGRTELAFDHRRTFEIVADGQFLRDTDAAMRLDGVLANELRAARNLALLLTDCP